VNLVKEKYNLKDASWFLLAINVYSSTAGPLALSEPTLIDKNKVAGNGWTIDLNSEYFIEKISSDKNYSPKKQ
jgi:hypothetical protein